MSWRDYEVIQLNDTTSTIAISGTAKKRADFDEHQSELGCDAWLPAKPSPTPTTPLMPEALECWDERLIKALLLRHMQIIKRLTTF